MARSRQVLKNLAFTAVTLLLAGVIAEAALAAWAFGWARAHRGPDVRGAVTLVLIGDSVTAGFGVRPGESYPDHVLQLLRRKGQSSVGVVTRAELGARLEDVEGWIRAAPPVSTARERRVAVLLMGHNNVVKWPAGMRNPFVAFGPGWGGAIEAPRWEPRVVRAARWMGLALRRDPPLDRVPPGVADRYRDTARRLLATFGIGNVFLATYAIPGEPPPRMDETLAGIIRVERDLQAQGNEVVRHTARELGAGLIDLERDLGTPSTWTRDWFQDGIHLTAPANRRVAEAILTRMVDEGILPVEAQP